MLDASNCSAYLASVKEFAAKIGKMEDLQDKLDWLSTYACNRDDPEAYDHGKTRCKLFKDFSPYSFEFVMERRGKDGNYEFWFNGGVIFHGNHDAYGSGSAPTLAVTLSPTDGWSIHT